MENQNGIDQELWYLARKRVAFKRHLAVYLVINAFFWALWWFTDARMNEEEYSAVPWPIFSMLGWGIGLFMNFLKAYVFNNRRSSIEKEYEKLKNK